MTASLMIWCPGLAVPVSALRIVAVPLRLLSRRHPRCSLVRICRATFAKKQLMLSLQMFVRLDAPEFGGELFKLGSALRDDHADRLPALATQPQHFSGCS